MKTLGMLFVTLAVLVPASSAQTPAPAPVPPHAETLPTVDLQKLGALPADADRRFAALREKVRPSAWAWIEQQARVEANRPKPDPSALRVAMVKRFGPHLRVTELDTVAFLVQMQASRDLETDMHDLLAHAQVGNQPQGQTDSLRLQTLMDRRSKMIDNLSNLLKKIGDTNASIVANLK
jgi:hypothetical protein